MYLGTREDGGSESGVLMIRVASSTSGLGSATGIFRRNGVPKDSEEVDGKVKEVVGREVQLEGPALAMDNVVSRRLVLETLTSGERPRRWFRVGEEDNAAASQLSCLPWSRLA